MASVAAIVPIGALISIPGAASAGSAALAALPAGVRLQAADGGAAYYSKWANGFPASSTFIPIGVFPAEEAPATLAKVGVNFMTPMRNDSIGEFEPTWTSATGDDMTHVDAQPGFYGGGSFYNTVNGKPWGARAAFNVYGDECDGQGTNCWLANLPSSLTGLAQNGSFGGFSGSSWVAVNNQSNKLDPTRPLYLQTTVNYIDGEHNYHYSLADKQAICSSAGILSFDFYPLVYNRSWPNYSSPGNVWSAGTAVSEGRLDCQNARPVMEYTEMDAMPGFNVYPLPAQTVAEVWDELINGARGVEYFDFYNNLTNVSYNGHGNYPTGAMYNAVKTTNAEITSLASVLNDNFANGYVTSSGHVKVMAKYSGGSFYIFASPTTNGTQRVTLNIAGSPTTQGKRIFDSNSTMYSSTGNLGKLQSLSHPNNPVSIKAGKLTTTFHDANEVKIFKITP